MPVNLSIVVSTNNRPQKLQKCIDGLLNQNFSQSAYEIIVVSDGPDNETELLVTSHPYYLLLLRYYTLPKKNGTDAACAYGWEQAKGKLIAFAKDDWQPHADWLKNIQANYDRENRQFRKDELC